MENCLPTYSYNNLYLPETLQHQKVLETIFILVLSTLKDISEKRLSDRGQKTFSIKDQVVKIIKFACHAISIATTLLLKHLAAIDNNKSSVTIQLHLQMLKFKFYVILYAIVCLSLTLKTAKCLVWVVLQRHQKWGTMLHVLFIPETED